MNRIVTALSVCALSLVSLSAQADDKLRLGFGMDVGVPDGAAVGIVASPWLPWLKVEGAGTYNYISEGMRGSVTLDPFKSPISLTLTGDLGGYFPGSIPGVNKSPTFGYVYENALLGLEVGKRTGFRFFLRGGVSHADVSVSNFNQAFTLPTGAMVGNPNVSLLMPSAKLGFTWLF